MPGQDKKLIFPPVLITYGPSKQYKNVTLEAFYRLEDDWYFAGILLEDYEKNKVLLSVQIKESENTYFDYFHFGDVNSRWIKIEDKVFLVKNDYTIEIWEADPYKRQIYSFNIIDDHKAWVHDVKSDERNNLWVAGLVNDNLNFFIQRIPNKQLE